MNIRVRAIFCIFIFCASSVITSAQLHPLKLNKIKSQFKGAELISKNIANQKSAFFPDSSLVFWENTTQWDTAGMEYYKYTPGNDISSLEFWIYDNLISDFKPDMIESYNYNTNGDIILIEGDIWNGSAWADNWKNSFNYDNQGNLILMKQEFWDGMQWLLDFGDSSVFTYTGSNIKIWEQYKYNMGTSSWEGDIKIEFTAYNTNNEPVEALMYEWLDSLWSADTMAKIINVEWSMGYNGIKYLDNEPTARTVLMKDSTGWKNFEKHSSIVNNNKLTQRLVEKWNSSAWQNYNRKAFSFDVNDNQTYESFEDWDTLAVNWKMSKGDSSDFLYGSLGEIIQEIEFWYENSVSFWKTGQKYLYYYSPNVAVKEFPLFEKIKIYPNPTDHSINLSFGEQQLNRTYRVKIYNLIGKQVHSESFNSKDGNSIMTVNLDHFQNGMYIINIESNNEMKSFRFVKN